MTDTKRDSRRMVTLSVLLGLAVFAAFIPICQNKFIWLDDPDYISSNPHVQGGLTWQSFKWAFTTAHAVNWHPFTWLSHILDAQFFGLDPGNHHFVSLCLHAASSILLFWFLVKSSRAQWPSLLATALFALHPLRVESVAWASERKDVLSVFFFMLTLLAYQSYARRRNGMTVPAASSPALPATPNIPSAPPTHPWRSYLATLALFTCGLMSKPMLVTVPFLLLLLDFWPLARWHPQPRDLRKLRQLVIEKIPFLLLAFGSSLITYIIQKHGSAVANRLPFGPRLTNAIVSYIKYLGKLFWPSKLAIFYPHPETPHYAVLPGGAPRPSEQWPLAIVLACAFILFLICIGAILQFKRRPWLTVGWFWFFGSLFPVIGLVQAGNQAMADRYTYIPSIGICLCVAWACAEFARHVTWKPFLIGANIAIVAICASLTFRQTLFWRDNLTLFKHALAVTENNALAYSNIGTELAMAGKYAEAAPYFLKALEADPTRSEIYLNFGVTREKQGALTNAISMYEMAISLKPDNDSAQTHLASARTALAELHLKQGNLAEAEAEFRAMTKTDPTNFDARINYAGLLWRRGLKNEAIEQYKQAATLEPNHPVVHFNLGLSYLNLGRLPEAIDQLRQAVQLKTNYFDALIQLSRAEAQSGNYPAAAGWAQKAAVMTPMDTNGRVMVANAFLLAHKTNSAMTTFAEAAKLDPGLAKKYLLQSQSLSDQSQLNSALARARTAFWLAPDDPDILQNLAWLLATLPDAQMRDGPEALRLARRALDLSGGNDAKFWAALDTASAETGQFTEAITAAEKARDLARAANNNAAVAAAEKRLALYREHKPFHQ